MGFISAGVSGLLHLHIKYSIDGYSSLKGFIGGGRGWKDGDFVGIFKYVGNKILVG